MKDRKWRELVGRYIFGMKEKEYLSLAGYVLPPDFKLKSLTTAETEGRVAPPSRQSVSL